ncbi:cell division protein FtsZ [bacterium]|nr:MAG: cell division protein FtsZ [bacterium]
MIKFALEAKAQLQQAPAQPAKPRIQVSSRHHAQIKVIGVGGAGGNVLDTMIAAGVDGVEFIVANTDAQALEDKHAKTRLQLGSAMTRGLGAGGDPEVGRQAAIESTAVITEVIGKADMVFITAGMGGGTGTGASPVIAQQAKEAGALTVGVVTKPFCFEGRKRMKRADEGIEALKKCVDTLLIIPNERLLEIAGEDTAIEDAYAMVDNVLCHAVRGISDLITTSGRVNVDFADVRAVMSRRGMALMGTGIRSGEGKASAAVHDAVSSPLLANASIQGAKSVLINFRGNSKLTIGEINEAAKYVQEAAHEDADIFWGHVIDENMGESVEVTVIATGFDELKIEQSRIEMGKDREKELKVANGGTIAPENLDVPTFIRGNAKNTSAMRVTRISAGDSDFGDLDAPTFLRKQAD